MAWIKFSKYTRISSQEQYFSRVWYQLPNAKAKELNDVYPASSELLLKGEPQEESWMVVDNPEIVPEPEPILEDTEAPNDIVPAGDLPEEIVEAIEEAVESDIKEESGEETAEEIEE